MLVHRRGLQPQHGTLEGAPAIDYNSPASLWQEHAWAGACVRRGSSVLLVVAVRETSAGFFADKLDRGAQSFLGERIEGAG